MAAVGTIAQNLRGSTVHLWGTGLDAGRRAFGNRTAAFAAAPDTQYVVHAVRGSHTRQVMLDAGLHVPPIYGDAGWYMPRLISDFGIEKKYELGVIPHISAMASKSPELDLRESAKRFVGSETDGVHVFNTFHRATWAEFRSKFELLLSCKRIVTTSFHGLIIADAYRIPCIYFPHGAAGATVAEIQPGSKMVDHRVADFYAGGGRKTLPVYATHEHETTAWDSVIKAIDQLYEPFTHPRETLFLEAFPFATAVDIRALHWDFPDALAEQIPW
ncbi:ExoV-like protein [Acetobacteraceae bacterium AT-5844]|nr:ExoV-like protein [Acetobacteraceae bacterium AT-5844]